MSTQSRQPTIIAAAAAQQLMPVSWGTSGTSCQMSNSSRSDHATELGIEGPHDAGVGNLDAIPYHAYRQGARLLSRAQPWSERFRIEVEKVPAPDALAVERPLELAREVGLGEPGSARDLARDQWCPDEPPDRDVLLVQIPAVRDDEAERPPPA